MCFSGPSLESWKSTRAAVSQHSREFPKYQGETVGNNSRRDCPRNVLRVWQKRNTHRYCAGLSDDDDLMYCDERTVSCLRAAREPRRQKEKKRKKKKKKKLSLSLSLSLAPLRARAFRRTGAVCPLRRAYGPDLRERRVLRQYLELRLFSTVVKTVSGFLDDGECSLESHRRRASRWNHRSSKSD